MTLNKAIQELFAELNRTDLSEEEKKALEKYKTWLCSIKGTVSNNTPYWHPYPQEEPKEHDEYGNTIMYLVTVKTAHVDVDAFVDGRWFSYSDEVIAWAELPKPFDARTWV